MAKATEVRLSADQVKALRQDQRALNELIEELDKAESCGIDCSQHREVHAEASDRINKLLKVYGPGLPQ